MPSPELIYTVINEWIAKAENDLIAGRQILKLGASGPLDTVCFHAQQCVEKYLKAMLVFLAVPFPKTHDLRTLIHLIPAKLRVDLSESLQDRMTQYAAISRYPYSGFVVTLRDAREALAIARRIRRSIRQNLPRAAVRKRKK